MTEKELQEIEEAKQKKKAPAKKETKIVELSAEEELL